MNGHGGIKFRTVGFNVGEVAVILNEVESRNV